MIRACIFLVFLGLSFSLSAQYFGKNKPRYRSFDFKVKETPHFDLHYYTKNKDVVNWFGQESEQWYDFYSQVLNHEIPFANPLIMYNNHAEFQQTNTISGAIGVGTGGVTEGFKNRVVMPLTFTNQQTHHVLGHEIVHAFQFNMVIGGDSTTIRNMANLPLWLVEGMAEYLSLGRIDPFTSMWMRNAILNDDVPSLQKMANPRYFPYRYGQAAWSFLAGYYGNEVMRPYFVNTAKYGLEYATRMTFGVNLKTLSEFWENSLKTHFDQYLGDRKESRIGRTLLSKENSGSINVSPSISPNGRWVVFLSEKDLFSTDVFLADARTGEIVRKLSSLVKDTDLDNLNFLESAGTWSPNSKEFAFVGFKKGKNVLVIKNAENGKTIETYEVPKVDAFTTPVWSPNGREIVFTGSNEGQTDLFSFNLKSKKVTQLTDDRYAEIQPHFSSDGQQLVFSYDKRSFQEGRTNGKWTFDLAIMDYATKEIEILDVFQGADNLNPNFDHENNIYFLSNRDGFRNMYKYMVSSGEVLQMTDFLTGLSGISRFSPVLSAARSRDRVLFTHYFGKEYIIKQANSERLVNKVVAKDDVNFDAGTLPIINLNKSDLVGDYHENIDRIAYDNADRFKNKKYTPNFKLDYVGGGAGVGVSNSTFGTYTGLIGGIDLLFSDMLGNHQLFSRLALNGTIHDFGGQVSYLNRTNKVAYGAGLSHIPSVTGFRTLTLENVDFGDAGSFPAFVDNLNLLRVFDQRVSLFSHLPFNTNLRLEGGFDFGRRSFRYDIQKAVYEAFQVAPGQFVPGRFIGTLPDENVDVGDELVFNQFYTLQKGMIGGANIALVGDNSFFGLTSPLNGYRYRLSLEKSFGINDFYGVLGDYRKYVWMKPISIAFRALGYMRFDQDVNSIYPVYIGQMGFVRGYDFYDVPNNIFLEQLLGSKVGMASFEIRLPFTGPRQLSAIPSNTLFTDLALFVDAGVAFDEFSHFSDGRQVRITDENGNVNTILVKPELAMSVGASVRVNLFGALILEPYWAYPLQENSEIVFGLNFIPGW